MKKFIGIFAFLMILLAAFVSAAPSMTVTNLNLGGSAQERSNPLSDREADFEIYVTGTITITNTGGENITDLTSVPNPASGFSANDLNATVALQKTTLVVGESTTARVTTRVPKYLDAIDSAFTATGMNVATIEFKGKNETGTALSQTSTVNVQAENMLTIEDVDIKITSGAETRTESGTDEKTIKDIKPGDSIELTIEVESKFSERDNVDIDDIVVIAVSQNADFDVDEEEDISSLSPKDKDTVTMMFEVDDDQERGDYDVAIEVDGEDENGARHGERWVLAFKVERESHEIQIKSAELFPSSVQQGKTTELKVDIRNIGRNDEDDATLAIAAPDLKFGDILNNLEIDEGDELTKRFTIAVPENVPLGTYRIEVKTFYSGDRESDSTMVLLKVLEKEEKEKEVVDLCAGVVCQDTTKICADGFVATCVNTCSSDTGKCSQCTPSCEGHEVVPPITGEVTEQPEVTEKAEVTEKEKISPWYIGGLVALNVIVLLIGIFLIVKLARK